MVVRIFIMVAIILSGSSFAVDKANILKLKNHKFDKAVLKKYKSYQQLLEIDDISEKLQVSLYKRVQRALKLIQQTRKITTKEKQIIESIFQKTDEFDLDDYDFDELNEQYEDLTTTIAKEKYHLKYYATVSMLTWNYRVNLINSDGTKTPLYSKERGPSLGFGLNYGNSYWGIKGESSYAYMTATVGEDSTSVKYNQSDVPIDALFLKLSTYYLPKEDIDLTPRVGPRQIIQSQFSSSLPHS